MDNFAQGSCVCFLFAYGHLSIPYSCPLAGTFRMDKIRDRGHFIIIAMLCKSTAVFVVPALVIFDLFWKRIQLRHWLELVPFCLVAMLILWANYDVQSGLLIHFHTPLWARPLVALDALGFYLGKVLWPLQVLPAYGRSPRWLIESGIIYWSWIPAAVLLATAFLARKRWPTMWRGLLIFIAGVVLTLGLVNFSAQDNSTVYDKYVYLAMLGPAYILAAILARPFAFWMAHSRWCWPGPARHEERCSNANLER